MSNDKIAEIRARHENDDRWRLKASMVCPGEYDDLCPDAHDDRAVLLAEVERLRAQVAEYFAEPPTHPVEREE